MSFRNLGTNLLNYRVDEAVFSFPLDTYLQNYGVEKYSILKMEVASSSEMFIKVQSRRAFIPEDGDIMFLRNVCIYLSGYMESPSRKLHFLSVRTANPLPQAIYSV